MAFTAFPTRSIAGRAYMDAQNQRLRQDLAGAQMQRYDDERAQDAALRSVLSRVNPSAPPDQMYGEVARGLSGVPGAGKSVLGMITAGQTARANAEAQRGERDWQRERFGLELDQKRQLGDQRLAQQRELAEFQNRLALQRIAASRAGGGGRGGGGGRRYRDPEDVVVGLLARGKIAEAQAVAQAKGVQLPGGVMERAQRDSGYRELLKVYEGDSDGFRRASEVYDQSGNLTDAFKAGGPGISGSGRGGTSREPRQPADIQTMEWMVQQGIAQNPQDAFTRLRALRSAANPQQAARQLADTWARTQLNVTEDQLAAAFQRFLAMQQEDAGGGDPLGLGIEDGGGADDDDPLGINSEDEE